MVTLDKFLEAMDNLGIDMDIGGNYPWIYITAINGKTVTEKMDSEHGFNVAFSPIKNKIKPEVTDVKKTLELIIKYI
jgi:predicted membrane GTPase involved in stress response